MKITVIGGSGFLGSHVADKLTSSNHQVKIFDIIESRYTSRDQVMITGDIMNKIDLDKAIKGSDIVYHFAGISDLNQAYDQPEKTVEKNILASIKILKSCIEHKVKRFIFASTVYVYSNEGGFYRCSKQAIEQYIEEFNRQYNLNFTILRYGSIYGPRSDSSNGMYKIIKKAIDENKIVYHGNKDSIREYIHVDDVAEASVRILSDEFKNQNVVLTGHQSMRVEDLLKTLAEILNISDKINFKKSKELGHYITTPYNYIPRLGKKFTPNLHVDLGQGLLQMIDEIINNDKK